jgi:hypothetical protein
MSDRNAATIVAPVAAAATPSARVASLRDLPITDLLP